MPRAKTAAKSKTRRAKTAKTAAKSPAPAKKRVAPAKKAPAKAKAPAAKSKKRVAKVKQEAAPRIDGPVLDPIGDVSNGEAHTYLGDAEELTHTEAEVAGVKTEALEAGPGMTAAAQASHAEDAEDAPEDEESGTDRKPRPAANPERLQKILSQAGIASRRHAEEMIVAGRVMVNGQVVTQLGSKADLGRDHIRVDGKLLHGAERHRYFMLNKPRGYVTTMSDPEHRPTVMEFFAKAQERVYPVGRLDYLSEGLLLMTNDGELANLLTQSRLGRGEDISREGRREAERRRTGALARRRDD